jgi:hypothetical protein
MPYAQDLYKTKMCSLYMQRGYCPRQSCSFAHGESELRKLPGEAPELPPNISFFLTPPLSHLVIETTIVLARCSLLLSVLNVSL